MHFVLGHIPKEHILSGAKLVVLKREVGKNESSVDLNDIYTMYIV
jgi:hypothetical protein